ncbi:transposase [Pseudarthrobacter sp. AB1]|uniref:transposase n=1 Tax=Pseudarthrobacter sp. AB1 TaxID=2138309 RepID=UPI00186BA0A3|nr:transposase [Pseudarthrobacter sp. AB1]
MLRSVDAGINFPHAAQAAQITRKSRPLGTRKWSTATVYIVTSLTPSQGKPGLIGSLIRGHWGIENGLHWRRDVTWREDGSQVRRGNAPRAMASLRIAITILRLEGETNIAKATRVARNYPHRALKLAGLKIN